MKDPYFIVSLPRCRTAWLANLLTWERSFCLHEASVGCLKGQKLQDIFRDVPHGTRYFGDADPSIGLFWREALEWFPKCRIVVVHRPFLDCLTSEYEAICDDGNKMFDGVTKRSLESGMKGILEGMDELWRALPMERKMLVRYSDLDREQTVRAVWRFCVPGIPFPVERYRMLDSLKVTQIFSKVIAKQNTARHCEAILERKAV